MVGLGGRGFLASVSTLIIFISVNIFIFKIISSTKKLNITDEILSPKRNVFHTFRHLELSESSYPKRD